MCRDAGSAFTAALVRDRPRSPKDGIADFVMSHAPGWSLEADAGEASPLESSRNPLVDEVYMMIHLLAVVAVVLLAMWLLFHATASLINLLWIGIVILAVLWLVGMLRSGRAGSSL